MKFELNLGKYTKKLKSQLIDWISEWQVFLKNQIDSRTPEDTKTLLWNNQISEIIDTWWKILWSVYNDTEYALYVERWLWREFNYHKPKWKVFKIWNWAKMFATTYDLDWKEAQNIIINKIKL